VLGFGALLALGINGIVGVGIFFTPSQVAVLLPGRSGALAYLLTALALVPVACVYAVLGGRFRQDGGPYVWARAAFGPAAAFFVGWVAYVSAILATATVVLALSRYLAPTLGCAGPAAQLAFGWVCVAVLGAIVAAGLRPSAWVWSTLTVAKVLPLALLVVLFLVRPAPLAAGAVSDGFDPANLGRAMLIALFALQGFEIVPVPSGSARAAHRSVPRATLASLAFATGLYVVLQLACAAAVPDLGGSDAPLVTAAAAYGGAAAAALVGAGTDLSALGIAFGMLAMTPRYLSVLGRADALGPWLALESARRVPLRALGVTVVAVCLLISVEPLGALFILSGLAVLAQYAVSAVALAKLALAGESGLRRRHAWPAPLALGAIVLLAAAATLAELWVMLGVLASGAGCYGLRVLASRRGARHGRPRDREP
jgi:amino acid transporter